MRAHLLAELGRHEEAHVHFRAAAEMTANEVERRYLLERAGAPPIPDPPA